jgi:predicted dehydrogenase
MSETSPSKIRWAVASTGRMAAKFVQDVRHLEDVEFAAVGSRSLATAQAFAETHGIARAHGRYADLIADPDIDVLYIATPHPQHYGLAMAAIERGIAVLVEKPFTVSLAGAEEIVALAREKGVFLMEAMWSRFLPAFVRARQLVLDGAIGEPQAVQASFCAFRAYDEANRLFNLELGGGTTLDLGVYVASFAQQFLGRPDEVLAAGTTFPNGADATVSALLRWHDGRSATLTSTLQAPGPNRGLVIGTEGTLEVSPTVHRPEVLILTRAGEEPVVEELPPAGHGYAYQVEEVNRCLRAGLTESPVVPLDDTLAVQWVLEEMLREVGRDVVEAPRG